MYWSTVLWITDALIQNSKDHWSSGPKCCRLYTDALIPLLWNTDALIQNSKDHWSSGPKCCRLYTDALIPLLWITDALIQNSKDHWSSGPKCCRLYTDALIHSSVEYWCTDPNPEVDQTVHCKLLSTAEQSDLLLLRSFSFTKKACHSSPLNIPTVVQESGQRMAVRKWTLLLPCSTDVRDELLTVLKVVG